MERSIRQDSAGRRRASGLRRIYQHHRSAGRRAVHWQRKRQWQHLSAAWWRLISLGLSLVLCSGCAKRPPDLATLYSRCSQDFEHGDLDLAIREAQEGLQRSEKDDRVWNYKFRILLANTYLWKGGKGKEALSLLDVDPPQELSRGEVAARRKALQGSALSNLHRFEEAHTRLREAEDLALSSAPAVESEILLDQGTLAFFENDLESAKAHFLKALPLSRSNHQAFLEVQITGSLGLIEGRQEHYGVSIDWLRKSLEIAQSIGARQLQAATLVNFGWMNSAIGDFESAVPAFQESERLTANAVLKEIAFNNLGEVYRNIGRYPDAWEAYSKAREIARQNPKYAAGLADCISGLAWVALAEGKLDIARQLEQEAKAAMPQGKDADPAVAIDLLILDASVLHAAGQLDQSEKSLLGILKRNPLPSDRWRADSELANVYVDMHKDRLAERQFDTVLRTLDAARSSLSDVEQLLAFSSRESRFYKSYVEFLISERKPFDAFRVADRLRARTLSEGTHPSRQQELPQLSLAGLESDLGRSKQVLISYWLAPKRSFAWLVTDSHFQALELPPSPALEPKIKAYVESTVNGKGLQDAAAQDGADLYKTLVLPFARFIPPDADVTIVPDGLLATLNFETLVVPGATPHYWIEDVTVSNVVSVSSLTRRGPVKHAPEDLLAIGDPVNESGSPALLHAKEEIHEVASYAPAVRETVLTGKQATPAAYTGSHPESFRWIHFAAHGQSNQIEPLESYILLSPDSENATKLYGHDIVKMKLNAELVTISSCKGGGGRIYGEGSVGLAWAFMKAGAHQVVAALWNLDDAAAASIMKIFYHGLSSHETPAAALHAAKLALLHDPNYQRPYYWATLQVYFGS